MLDQGDDECVHSAARIWIVGDSANQQRGAIATGGSKARFGLQKSSGAL
jgi:hypothetical protein